MIIVHQVKPKAHRFVWIVIYHMFICNKHRNAFPFNFEIKEETSSGTAV